MNLDSSRTTRQQLDELDARHRARLAGIAARRVSPQSTTDAVVVARRIASYPFVMIGAVVGAGYMIVHLIALAHPRR